MITHQSFDASPARPLVVFASGVAALLAEHDVDDDGREVGQEPVVVEIVEINGPEFSAVTQHIPLVKVGVYEAVGFAIGWQRQQPVLDALTVAAQFHLARRNAALKLPVPVLVPVPAAD